MRTYVEINDVNYIINQFIEIFHEYEVVVKVLSEYERAIILNDAHIYIISYFEHDFYGAINSPDINAYNIHIEEVTYNTIGVKYNHAAMIRRLSEELKIDFLSVYFTYSTFKGTKVPFWPSEPSVLESYNEKFPELKLIDRFEKWEGIKYNFIVMEFIAVDFTRQYLVAYTKTNAYTYIHNYISKALKQKNLPRNEARGNWSEVLNAFRSWKKLPMIKRFENHFYYYVFEYYVKVEYDAWQDADRLLDAVNTNSILLEEKYSYERPINKWKSEELVYKIIKRYFKEYAVIYQHRPEFLISDKGGQLSYDIYISKLKIAIEYQGQQHFKPIDFFGGEDSFIDTKSRDEQKKLLSEINGIDLIYINYWEELTKEVIIGKITKVLEQRK